MADLIEVKTADLAGEPLAWVVGKAEGLDVRLAPPHYGNPWRVFVRYSGEVTVRDARYDPHENWAVGGPLIHKYRVGFGLYPSEYFACIGVEDHSGTAAGRTHLLAACRAIAAAKLGDTVQVPKELCQ
ncbi:DUF2591 family protein [Pseudomonas juntendi]|nr:DUF2591 family protein [Pseudomonas juntendi]